MEKIRCRLFARLFGFLLSSFILTALPLSTGYAAERSTVIPEIREFAPPVAMNFGSSDPVAVVVGASEILGFNPKVDTFTLIKQDAAQAIVQVSHNGAHFNVILEPAFNNTWTIATMNSAS